MTTIPTTTLRQTVADLMATQVILPEWMVEAVAGLTDREQVDVTRAATPFGTYVLSIDRPECGAVADPRRESKWITDPVCHRPAGHSGTHVCVEQRGERAGFIYTTGARVFHGGEPFVTMPGVCHIVADGRSLCGLSADDAERTFSVGAPLCPVCLEREPEPCDDCASPEVLCRRHWPSEPDCEFCTCTDNDDPACRCGCHSDPDTGERYERLPNSEPTCRCGEPMHWFTYGAPGYGGGWSCNNGHVVEQGECGILTPAQTV